jgi:secondary thiamine-phosphate synthase enzyme
MKITLDKLETVPLHRMVRCQLSVDTRGPGFTDISESLDEFLHAAGAEEGLLALFIRHTSASLTVQENVDPDVWSDLQDALMRVAPENAVYRHGIEGPDDMPSHIKTMLTDVSLAIPVVGGRMALGTYQGVFLLEHRAAGRRRTITLIYLGA